MDVAKKCYGVMTCMDHKTIGFMEKDGPIVPCTEQQGACGLCYWFNEKQEALSKTEELIANGYSLHRILDYPNYYTGKLEHFAPIEA